MGKEEITVPEDSKNKKIFTSRWTKYIVIVALLYIMYFGLIYLMFER